MSTTKNNIFHFNLEPYQKPLIGDNDRADRLKVCDVECIKLKQLVIGNLPYLDNEICVLHRNAMKIIEAYHVVISNDSTKKWGGWSEWA
jgi:hypothetical protein